MSVMQKSGIRVQSMLMTIDLIVVAVRLEHPFCEFREHNELKQDDDLYL